jgi:predicted regulator of Ras-like GTPase activity (Roadblock/LC7/MglB family)
MTGPRLSPGQKTPEGTSTHSLLATQICRSNPTVTLAFVVDSQGNVQPTEKADQRLLKAAVAMVVPFRELAERTAAELGCGMFRCVLLEGESASIAMADVDGERIAVVVGGSDSFPGALRADALWFARSLRSE